jgi:hypothetical protein
MASEHSKKFWRRFRCIQNDENVVFDQTGVVEHSGKYLTVPGADQHPENGSMGASRESDLLA